MTPRRPRSRSGPPGATSGTSGSFLVQPAPVHLFTLSTPSPTAGTPFTETITAIDVYSNPATGFTGTQCVAFTGPASAPNGNAPSYPAQGGCASGSSLTFNANGQATASVTLYRRPEHHADRTSGSASGTSTSFTVSSAVRQRLTATSGSNQSAKVNTAFTNKLVATATDAYGNGGVRGLR